ncbi:MAG TPA: dihydrolipoyl dehydrogenase [Syntrophobacter fumaroxidans]|nr:dihydrolipoyl dehydrogenase [Syntrophobacter fumaroxidans]
MVMGEFTQETDVLVIGAGPGGYAAAFRAADLGLDVTMVDTGDRPGGVCLFRGCIPSKTLLYVTELLYDVGRAADMGISLGEPQIDLPRLREWKKQVVDKLAGGLVELCRSRGVQFLQGRAVFESSSHARLLEAEISRIKFKHAVIATGSHTRSIAGAEFRDGGRIMDSTGALELTDIPKRLLVVGGGYVGVELGSVYASLGSRVTMVEAGERLMAGADQDLTAFLSRRLSGLFEAVHVDTRIQSLREFDDRVEVELEGKVDQPAQSFDRVLIAVGREPNSGGIGLEKTGVEVNEHGFIVVDEQRRTTDGKIFAVGDAAGGVMLAHKAMHEGKVAAEAIAGQKSAFDYQAIPAVVYADPQLAWVGLTEEQARRENRPVKVSRFPWSASGRAATMGVPRGMTKVIVDPVTQRVLGVGIVGREAGEMIAEAVLALEMGALAEDLALSMHPHPTLSESEEEAAEAFLGTSIHILPQRR